MKRAAILAHYDIDGIADSYLKNALDQLHKHTDIIIIVTTSGFSANFLAKYTKLFIIHRENFGYDFYSYKIGLEKLPNINLYDQVIILNDSFYCLPNFDLRAILNASMTYDIFAMTASNQLVYHLQSYFIIYSKKMLLSTFFYQFWKNIFSYKKKITIIINYEINFTRAAIAAGFRAGSFFKSDHNKNPCHFDTLKLAKKVGILKIDVLRNDIGNFSLEKIPGKKIIETHLQRTKKAYSNRLLSGVDTLEMIPTGIGFFEYIKETQIIASAAVILHLFYVDLQFEIKHYLDRIPYNYDLFITINDESFLPEVINTFQGSCNKLYISCLENKGRDIKPFVELMKFKKFNCYSHVLKIHTKKSKYSTLGEEWRKEIYSNLLPSANMINKIKIKMQTNNIGIVAAKCNYLSHPDYWGANQERFHFFCNTMNVPIEHKKLFFIAGSMFWFKPTAIYPLIDHICVKDFENEKNQQDGTLAHVFERLTCVITKSSGYKCVAIDHLDKDLNEEDVLSNRLKVLD